MLQTSVAVTAEDLRGYRQVQRLAYECAEAVGATLEPGMSEKDAARAMRRWLRARGVEDWFHLPFAWFGDRTAFRHIHAAPQFFPTDRQLEVGMPYILDCAPIVDGYVADIGYAGCLGENPVHARMLDDLIDHRRLILEGVQAGKSLRGVYEDVDRLLMAQGYDNRHRCYPFGVLAHRVDRVEGPGAGTLVAGFGVRGLGSLLRGAIVGLPVGTSPLWGPTAAADRPPSAGVWAIEPHLGHHEVGAKFEELLVVMPDGAAFWLDDDVPHVRRRNAS